MGDTGFMPELVKFLDAGFENCLWDEPGEFLCVPQCDCDEFASENLWCFKLSFLKQQIDFDSFRFHFYITSGIFICCLFASIECLGEEIFIVKLGDMIMFENCVCEMSQKSLLVFVSVTEMNFLGKFFEIFSFGFRKAFHCFRIAFQKLW